MKVTMKTTVKVIIKVVVMEDKEILLLLLLDAQAQLQ